MVTSFNRACANYVIRLRTRSKHDVTVLINNMKILKLVTDSSNFQSIFTLISINNKPYFLTCSHNVVPIF